MTDVVTVEAPLAAAYQGVVRLMVGGVAERAGLGFEEMDDLQLAVERLLAEAGGSGSVSLRFELGDGAINTHIGPLHSSSIARALEGPALEPAGTLGLRRVLAATVDEFAVDHRQDGEVFVRLLKASGGVG